MCRLWHWTTQHIPCVQPGALHLVWVPQSSSLATVAHQRWQLVPTESLPKEGHGARPHFVIICCKLTFSKDVQIPLKTQRKDIWKLPAAEWLWSGDSSMTKGGKMLFIARLWISPTLQWSLGSGNFMFQMSAQKPKKKITTPVQRKKKIEIKRKRKH